MDAKVRRAKARFIALYLPQFHPIPENDAWWGKGFTEWTNVARAKPLYRGHYQPRLPADLGYYDLRVPETRMAQAELARDHGVEGFCYWHYWFAGDRLLERPFNEVLRSGQPDFPFCLAWANESWTGIWYGAPNRVLKEQTYPGFKDHEAHFHTLLEAFTDPRYLTVDGRPIFVIYRPQKIPDVKNVTNFWRELADKAGLKGLHLVASIEEGRPWDPIDYGFDAITIANQGRVLVEPAKRFFKRWRYQLLDKGRVKKLWRDWLGRPIRVRLYEDALPYFVIGGERDYDYYPAVVPDFDNTPRCGLDGLVLHGATPELFRIQVREAMQRVAHLPEQRRIVFVKSWNEWAEGNYLEPDQRYGKAYLRAIEDEAYREHG